MEAEERGSWGEAREENCETQVTAVLFIPPIADFVSSTDFSDLLPASSRHLVPPSLRSMLVQPFPGEVGSSMVESSSVSSNGKRGWG
jgi:hypothetical protein